MNKTTHSVLINGVMYKDKTLLGAKRRVSRLAVDSYTLIDATQGVYRLRGSFSQYIGNYAGYGISVDMSEGQKINRINFVDDLSQDSVLNFTIQ